MIKNYKYKVHESILVMIFGIAFFVFAALMAAIGFIVNNESDQVVCFWVAFFIALIGLVILYEYYRRVLFVIEEGKEYLYRPFIGSSRHFYRSDIAKHEIRTVKFSPQDLCIVLYDYDGKKIVGLELNMVNADRFADEISGVENDYVELQEKNGAGQYFKESEESEFETLSENDIAERKNKVAKYQKANYALGALILVVAAILLFDKKLFCLIFLCLSVFTWFYFIIARDYIVLEHPKKCTYDKSMYASAAFPIWSLSVATLFGLNGVFNDLHYTDNKIFFVVLGFTIFIVILFKILPNKKEYKFSFYLIIMFVAAINGWIMSSAITYLTGEVVCSEEIEIIDARTKYEGKQGKNYYITINSDSFSGEEIEVTSDTYDKVLENSNDIKLFFAEDIFGIEYYYLDDDTLDAF